MSYLIFILQQEKYHVELRVKTKKLNKLNNLNNFLISFIGYLTMRFIFF